MKEVWEGSMFLVRLEDLVFAARAEDRGYIAKHLTRALLFDDPEILEWAMWDGLIDENPNCRDLAIRILTLRRKLMLPPAVEARLHYLMDTDESSDIRLYAAYVLYRCGCVSPEVMSCLWGFLKNFRLGHHASQFLVDG